jgi:hypothetical protein
MKLRAGVNRVAAKLISLKNNGVRHVKVFYTQRQNGKIVPHYKRIALTAALVGAAGAGVYYYFKHRKHGPTVHKKEQTAHVPHAEVTEHTAPTA